MSKNWENRVEEAWDNFQQKVRGPVSRQVVSQVYDSVSTSVRDRVYWRVDAVVSEVVLPLVTTLDMLEVNHV